MITVFSFTCSILCGSVAIGANLCRSPVGALDLSTCKKTYFASDNCLFRLRRLSSKFHLYRSCALRRDSIAASTLSRSFSAHTSRGSV